MTKQESNNRKYWQNQNLKRMNVGLSRVLMNNFRNVRAAKKFTNDDQMLEYLLDIERTAREQNAIIETKACAQCGAPINVELDSYNGITHQHVDSKSNCFGCIKTKYKVKTKIELPTKIEIPSESTITKVGQQMQAEEKDRAIHSEQKAQKFRVKLETDPRILAFNKLADDEYTF